MTAALLVAGVVASGLIAGLFWGWAVAVGPGLAKVNDRTYVATMQAINVAIINPIFLTAFVGTIFVLAAASALSFGAGDVRRASWLAAAAGTYVVAVFGVTVGGNVPLNNQLEAFDLAAATDSQVSAARDAYERPWNRFHSIRTIASSVALALAAAGAMVGAD